MILGLAMGSFAGALVWRLHAQEMLETKKSKNKKYTKKDLSIVHGRSMCGHCGHTLAAIDLIPLFSWLLLKGKCRYCKKPIGWLEPVLELTTAALFVASYIFWPSSFDTAQWLQFGLWLAFLTGLIALFIYDIKWMLLPNRIVYPLIAIAAVSAVTGLIDEGVTTTALVNVVTGAAIGGGLFWLLFQMSGGKWIGGGDVKLGFALGLMLANPALALLLLFSSSVIGSAYGIPYVYVIKKDKTKLIPFGPFLIIGMVFAQLFGPSVVDWYREAFLLL